MIRLIFLSGLLFVAGMVHLFDPFAFANAIPPFIPLKLEIIYATGILELVLAAGLIWKKSRRLTAIVTAVYFSLLLPIHLYISINVIQMFGVSDPFLLWVRTLFQFVLIYWAWTLRKV